MKERIKKMINLRKKGLSYRQIGKKFGISRQRVHQILTGYDSHKTLKKNVKALEVLFGIYEK